MIDTSIWIRYCFAKAILLHVCILRCGQLLNDKAGLEIFQVIDQITNSVFLSQSIVFVLKVTFALVFDSFDLGVVTFWR